MSWGALGLLLALVVAVSWVMVGRLIKSLNHRQIVDRPNDRTLHQGVIARGGGLAIVAILLVALIAVGVASARLAMFGAFSILMLAWAWLGWRDDRHDLSTPVRILFQSAFAVLMIAAFGYIDQIQLANERVLLLSISGAVITWVGIMWLCNLYNFMDGMDGLAASQTIVAALTSGIWFWQYGDQDLALVCLILAAATYGFLLWNWHPARIFLGDVGSLTLGAFFALIIIIGSHRYNFPVISFVLLLGVFVADASLTVLRRVWNGEKIWVPHRSHYYQRLANRGLAHDQIVIGEILLMLICSLIATTSVLYRDSIWLCVLAEVALLGAAVFSVLRYESQNK